MYFLTGATRRGMITLHVRGFCDEKGQGFCLNEGIFLAEKRADPEHPEQISIQIGKQVGIVTLTPEKKIAFHYTDAEFKILIGYEEKTGYSSLDGAAWQILSSEYLSAEGKVERTMRSNSPGLCMYTSAYNPFSVLAPRYGFFQPARTEVAQKPEEQERPSLSTN